MVRSKVYQTDLGAIKKRIDDLKSLVIELTDALSAELEEFKGAVPVGGFENLTDSTIAFDDGTRTFSIDVVDDSFVIWSDSKYYKKKLDDEVVLTDVEGNHFIYYDGDGVLTCTTGWDDMLITTYALIAIIYWDATNNEAIIFGDERHGYVMSAATHEYEHFTRGAQLESGGALGDILADENGTLDSHCQFSVEATDMFDEDIMHNYTARASTADISVYYRDGVDASNIWRVDDSASFPVLVTTDRPDWNELSGGSWVRTEVTLNSFILAHVFTMNDTTRKFGVIMGQGEYLTIGQARDGALVEINDLILNGLPTPEFVFLGTIIVQGGNYANAVGARIRSTDDGADYIDLRGAVITRSGTSPTVTDHGSLTSIGVNTHDQIDTHITDAEADIAALQALFPLQLTDLSDVASKEGSGSKVVMSDTPTIETPRVTDLSNMTHTHTSAATGGSIAVGEDNVGESVGTGTPIYLGMSGVKLQFREIIAGGGITISIDGNGNAVIAAK